ncbi:MAG: hypothetical protein AAF206_05195 [Bacteroidota bacterium]
MKYLHLFWGLCLSFLFSSCLTIEENYQFNANGSGHFEFVIDLGKMAPMFDQERTNPDSRALRDLHLADFIGPLERINGIRNVAANEDFSAYRFRLAMDFDHLMALNQALNVLLQEEENRGFHVYFAQKEDVLVSTHKLGRTTMAESLLTDPALTDQAQEILRSMAYRVSYQFKKPIRVAYTTLPLQASDKKKRMIHLETDFYELLQNQKVLDASIRMR